MGLMSLLTKGIGREKIFIKSLDRYSNSFSLQRGRLMGILPVIIKTEKQTSYETYLRMSYGNGICIPYGLYPQHKNIETFHLPFSPSYKELSLKLNPTTN
ncbi:hypothetical protein HY212_03560 [Candidatus Pacearchaeota archaeon]|nr:hypothetical protein [Candidatus Pacearchaeota archaeon]